MEISYAQCLVNGKVRLHRLFRGAMSTEKKRRLFGMEERCNVLVIDDRPSVYSETAPVTHSFKSVTLQWMENLHAMYRDRYVVGGCQNDYAIASFLRDLCVKARVYAGCALESVD